MARAATLAVKEAGAIAKRDARASIAAAGFSIKWQNALRVNTYPTKGYSMGAAALVFHNIDYAGIFDEGGTIRGNPFMWLPLNIPRKIGAAPITPRLFRQHVGPLFRLNRPGKRPLLMARTPGIGTRFTFADLRRAARNDRRGGKRMIPVFVGIDEVNIKKKFDVAGAVERAAARLGDFFNNALED